MGSDYPGMGVMINALGGNKKSVEVFTKGIGKTIGKVYIDDNALHFVFTDGYKMKLVDSGQSCCESRYMVCDDNLNYFTGAVLRTGEIKEAPNVKEPDDHYDDQHEVQFLEIGTDKGVFTVSNHNEHNGYYGGFWIEAQLDN